METHIRYLAALFHQNAIPAAVVTDKIKKFSDQYDDEAAVEESVSALLDKHADFVDKARDLVLENDAKLALGRSQISERISHIDEDHKQFMMECVASAGLESFSPDIAGGANSAYNLVHERVALRSFQLVSEVGCYSFCKLNRANLKNKRLLKKMYRNFVYGRLKGLVRKELKAPGRALADCVKTNAGKRRTSVSFHLLRLY